MKFIIWLIIIALLFLGLGAFFHKKQNSLPEVWPDYQVLPAKIPIVIPSEKG